MSRRSFLAGAAGALTALAAGPRRLLADAPPAGIGTPTVAIVRSDLLIRGMQVRVGELRGALDRAVQRLAGAQTPAAAWGQFVQPGQRVLLKFARLGGDELGTEQAMLEALVRCLELAGCRRGDLMAVDCRCAGLVPGLREPPAGWSRPTVPPAGQQEQTLRRYLDEIDVIVNVPYVCDHNLAGVAGALWNVTLPFIRHPGRHFDSGLHETIVELAARTELGGRVRLTLVNALRCVGQGGPLVDAEHVFHDHGVWAATDMVAADRLALERIDRYRLQANLPQLAAAGRPATFIDLAGRRGLGQSDPRWIRVRAEQL